MAVTKTCFSAKSAFSAALGGLLLALVAASASAQVSYRDDQEEVDPRLKEERDKILGKDLAVFQLDCRNAFDRQEVSLFANGTIRIREGVVDAPEMWLGELTPAATSELIESLQLADISEEKRISKTVVGDWIETCTYDLRLPGEERRVFQFERLDALSLPLQTSLDLARSLLGMVDRTVPSESRPRLPIRYRPELGDVLVSTDGAEFRISGFANDDTVVEMVGVDQPVVLFHAVSELGLYFVEFKGKSDR